MSPRTPTRRLRRFVVACAVYGGITVMTLVLLDLALIVTGLFPPKYNEGDAELGWTSISSNGEMREDFCFDFSAGNTVPIVRNEDGVRSSHSALTLEHDSIFAIAVSGDSQTELCAQNDSTHFGVLERELRSVQIPAATYSGAAGKYSPLQAYLAVKRFFPDYAPDALVLNLYTGNDFYDMIRNDDRPHFVPDGSGYRIAEPVWYQETPPGTVRRSRVLFAFRSIADRTGLRNIWVRIRYLRDAAISRGEGIGTVVHYMNDLRRSMSPDVGYSGAFAAQMLNQQLFFHHFPQSREESVVRVRALLELIREENPGMVLILSPLPSYHLLPGDSVDTAFLDLFDRLPLTYQGGLEEETLLYESLREIAVESGWLFVDNLPLLKAYTGSERLFNSYDYHFTPPASEIIGRAQAETLLSELRPEASAP